MGYGNDILNNCKSNIIMKWLIIIKHMKLHNATGLKDRKYLRARISKRFINICIFSRFWNNMTESYVSGKNRNTYSRSISFTRFTCDVNGRKSDSNRLFFFCFSLCSGLETASYTRTFPAHESRSRSNSCIAGP